MFRKSILALAAVAALGSVALAPTGAEAYWGGGYGRYGCCGLDLPSAVSLYRSKFIDCAAGAVLNSYPNVRH